MEFYTRKPKKYVKSLKNPPKCSSGLLFESVGGPKGDQNATKVVSGVPLGRVPSTRSQKDPPPDEKLLQKGAFGAPKGVFGELKATIGAPDAPPNH